MKLIFIFGGKHGFSVVSKSASFLSKPKKTLYVLFGLSSQK